MISDQCDKSLLLTTGYWLLITDLLITDLLIY